MSINHVALSGNLTRDPELKTANNVCLLKFGIAVNEKRKTSEGTWEDFANFVECTVFGARAEGLFKFLRKGHKVALTGKLRYSAWEKDGAKRSKLEVLVDEVDVMTKQDKNTNSETNVTPEYYEDIPF